MPKQVSWLFLLLIVISTGCAFHTPAEKLAVDRAAAVKNPPLFKIVNNPSLLIPTSKIGILKIDGKPAADFAVPNSNALAVSPGQHALTFLYYAGGTITVGSSASSGGFSGGMSSTSRISSSNQEAVLDFKINTHYSMDSIDGSQFRFSFEPVTDAAGLSKVDQYLKEYALLAEKIKSDKAAFQARLDIFTVFAKENPNYLEGRWVDPQDERELEFRGNTVKFIGPKIIFFTSRMRIEGTFVYDQNAIVTYWDDTFSEIWAYQKNGDNLVIKPGGIIANFPLRGNYQKIP
jgi:hypothetical protein